MEKVQKTILEKIKQYDTIIIFRHLFPDPDALGSQGGLQKAIQNAYPKKKVYVVGDEAEQLKFMNTMDDVELKEYKEALIIVLDTANTSRISGDYTEGDYVIKIDHHPNTDPYGDINWVDTSYSSTSEMIYELIQNSFDLFLSDDAARLLFSGIVGDTGRFQFPNTTEKTMLYASELLRFNFNPQDFYEQLYLESREVSKLRALALTEYEVTPNGVAHFTVSKSIMEKYNVTEHEASNLVNCLSNIEGNHIWLFFIEGEEDYRVRIRSKKTPINHIAKEFGGGGHTLAAGTSVDSLKRGDELIAALDKALC